MSQSDWGSRVVGMQAWHWNPGVEEEVCYNSAGREHMRYNPKIDDCNCADPAATSLSVQVGNVEDPA